MAKKWYTDEEWALWCEEYVQIAQESGTAHGMNLVMAERHGRPVKSIATSVDRMRARGFLTRYESRLTAPALTPKAQRIVDAIHRRENAKVYFNVEVAVDSKVAALAEMWDVIQQLEHWDERTGEPFQYRPARMQTLGEDDA